MPTQSQQQQQQVATIIDRDKDEAGSITWRSVETSAPQETNAITKGTLFGGLKHRKVFWLKAHGQKRYAHCKAVIAEQWGQDWHESLGSCVPANFPIEQLNSVGFMRQCLSLARETKAMSMKSFADLLLWHIERRPDPRLGLLWTVKQLHEKALQFKQTWTAGAPMTEFVDFVMSDIGARDTRVRSESGHEQVDSRNMSESPRPYKRASRCYNRRQRSISLGSDNEVSQDGLLEATMQPKPTHTPLPSSRRKRPRALEDDVSETRNSPVVHFQPPNLDKTLQLQILPGMKSQLLIDSLHSCNKNDESEIEVIIKQLTTLRQKRAQVAIWFNNAVGLIGACKEAQEMVTEAVKGLSEQQENLAELGLMIDLTRIDDSLGKVVARAPRTDQCLNRQLEAMTSYRFNLEDVLRQADSKIRQEQKAIDALRSDIAARMEAIAAVEEKQGARCGSYFESGLA